MNGHERMYDYKNAPEPWIRETLSKLYNRLVANRQADGGLAAMGSEEAAKRVEEIKKYLDIFETEVPDNPAPEPKQNPQELTVERYRLDLGGVTLERVGQMKGPDRWAIRSSGRCLNKAGRYEMELTPSSRTDGFLARCRFESVKEAMQAWDKGAGISRPDYGQDKGAGPDIEED